MNVTFLYPFLDHAAKGDELRWSLRSLRNVRGCTPVPVVIGRPPSWYRGPALTLAENQSREIDVQSKLLVAAWSDLVTTTFVAISDDTVITQPIEIGDLQAARARGVGPLSAREIEAMNAPDPWMRMKKRSLTACLDRGWSTWDTATHWPWTFEKQKLIQLYGELDLLRQSMLIEILYANRWNHAVKPAAADLGYVRVFKSAPEWNSLMGQVRVLNWADSIFNDSLRTALHERFPEPSEWEVSGPEVVQISEIDSKTVVARQSCMYLNDPIRREYNPFKKRMDWVFGCQKYGECVLERINSNSHRRCIACADRVLTNRVVEVSDIPMPAPKRVSVVPIGPVPLKSELLAANEQFACGHRGEISYTVEVGQRACVKRPLTVWKCDLHGECALSNPSCLGGKVKQCPTCPDLVAPIK